MPNIFREAKELLDTKPVREMTEEEAKLIATARIPLMLLREYNDTPIDQGLEELANIVDGAGPRGRVEVTQRPHKPFTQVRFLPPLPQ